MTDAPRWARPEVVFVAVASGFGLAFALATPPLDPADERRHIHRAWALSEGHALPLGEARGHRHPFPRSLRDLHPRHRLVPVPSDSPDTPPAYRTECRHGWDGILAAFDAPLAPGDGVWFEGPHPYGPVPYAIPALALGLARGLDLSAGATLYLGRLATLAVWLALSWVAIRRMPARRWTLVALALTPMAVFQGSYLTADAVHNGLAWLLFAWVLDLTVGPARRVGRRDIAVLVGACASLGLSKPGYWPLAALVALIPTDRFAGWGARCGLVAACVAALVVCTAAWGVALTAAETMAHGPDPFERAAALLTNPGDFARITLRTFEHFGPGLVAGFIGILGHLDVQLPAAVYVAYTLALPLVAIGAERDPASLTAPLRAGFVAVGLVCALSILALHYVGVAREGASFLHGLQGRHFIPVAPLLLLGLPGRFAIAPLRLALGIGVASCVGLAVSVDALVRHYFAG